MNHNTSAQCHTKNGEVFMTDQSGNGHHLKHNIMKPLSQTYKELGIGFSFPIDIKDANGRVTYHENSDDYWHKCEYDARGKETYIEYSDGTKRGTPRSAKASIILDEEESIRFAEMLKAAPRKPTPAMQRAIQAYRDFIVEHNQ